MEMQGATVSNNPISVSASKKSPRRRRRGGENVRWHRIKDNAAQLRKAHNLTAEVESVISRFVVFKHINEVQADAAYLYSHIMARHDKYFVPTKRTARSPSYERAFGEDQEIETRINNGSIDAYERRAREAKKNYLKLIKILEPYADTFTGRNKAKDVLDDLCCADIEPPSEFREAIRAILTIIAKQFGVQARRQGRRDRR